MKIKLLHHLIALLLLPFAVQLPAQDAANDPAPAAVEAQTQEADPPAEAELRLNFRNARLDQILEYLSEAAGFTILLETEVKGTIDVWSNRPVTEQEAIDILDSALASNGYAAIRDGRKLKIVSKDKAITENIPIIQSSEWQSIPLSDTVATYIVPLRYIGAAALKETLQSFIPAGTDVTPNADSNSLLVTGSQGSVRRIVQITSLLDSSVSSVSSLNIISLKYADAAELAETLTEVYSQQNRNSRGNTTGRGGFQFPGRRGN
jgi:general secretion pathway protein D